MAYEPGPYDSKHWYLQWGGKLPGNEQWSCGLRLANTAGGDPINDPAMLAACKTAIQAFHVSVGASISQPAKLSFVKLNLIGTDGHYVAPVTYQTIVADVSGGGPASAPYPNQIALAVSLTTGFSRGPAHRGRFYLPLPGFNLDGTGLIAAANANVCSGAVDTLVAALNAVSANAKVAVFSRKFGAAAHNLVTGNLVGRVYDTQRRRRRSLIEDYQ